MPFARARRTAASRFAWLLWLGLLLPLAQHAAATHALSHARTSTGRDEPNPQAPHLAHCDLCLSAAAIGGAAPGAAPVAFVAPPLSAEPALDLGSAPRVAAPSFAYRSRAPPVLAS